MHDYISCMLGETWETKVENSHFEPTEQTFLVDFKSKLYILYYTIYGVNKSIDIFIFLILPYQTTRGDKGKKFILIKNILIQFHKFKCKNKGLYELSSQKYKM
jgi:hypothetical protein